MTYEAVQAMAEGGFGVVVTAFAKEALRCWDLLETQANQLDALKDLAVDEKRHLVRWIDGSHLVDVSDVEAALGSGK